VGDLSWLVAADRGCSRRSVPFAYHFMDHEVRPRERIHPRSVPSTLLPVWRRIGYRPHPQASPGGIVTPFTDCAPRCLSLSTKVAIQSIPWKRTALA